MPALPEKPEKSEMRNRATKVILPLGIVALAVLIAMVMVRSRQPLSPGGAEPPLPKVQVVAVQPGEIAPPIGQPSCGSVFRNPPGDFAARLIETAGLKGTEIGGARVSEKHANFIISRRGARAADIEQLIRHVQETVKAVHGVELVPEVRVAGEAEQ